MTPRHVGSQRVLPLVALFLVVNVFAPRQTAFQGHAAVQVLVGEVESVLDGDTIRVRFGVRVETVRYIGVTTPETHHPTRGAERGGRQATEVNRALVRDKTVRLELDAQERDRDGRLLAYVSVGDRMINAELVRRGYARVIAIPPNVKHQDLFLQLQREAQNQKRGLWADSAPQISRPRRAPTFPSLSELAAEYIRETASPTPVASRPGVAPQDSWTCPTTHPIKGNFTTSSGERCIHHMPSGRFYGKTKPERCYSTEDEAYRDGCRRSTR